MIGEDRVSLNERFIKVFNELERKGEIVKNDRNGKGMGDFADKILGKRGYGHIVRAFLKPDDKRVIDYKHIAPLCKHYGVNRAYMLQGKKPMFGNPTPPHDDEVSRPIMGSGNITYTSVSALAGSGAAPAKASKEETDTFRIPGVGGSELYALKVEGDSMYPLLNDGEIVICERVESANQVKDNEVCVVKAEGEVWIKYVKTVKNRAGRVKQLKLISENKLEYDPFFVDVDESIRIYRVIRRISKL
jgi:SOS-response transcriptional repressor LexA